MTTEPSQYSGRVLLTGASGFSGGHILAKLLSNGIHVRAVVRSKKRDALIQIYAEEGNERLDFALVENMTATGAFETAFKSEESITSVIHTASPFLHRDVHNNLDLLEPTIKGTLRILETALSTPTVKRVILTSSIGADLDYTSGGNNAGGRKVYTGDDWNPITWEEALHTRDKATAYRASKKFSEKAAWNFMKDKHPSFDFVTLLPVMVYGPMLRPVYTIRDLNESNLRIWKLFLDSTSSDPMPSNGVHLFVDPRDVAPAHLQAILQPDAGSKRLILYRGPVTSQQIADSLRHTVPEFVDRIPMGTPGMNTSAESDYLADGNTTAQLLGLQYRDMETTFVDLGMQLRSIGMEEA